MPTGLILRMAPRGQTELTVGATGTTVISRRAFCVRVHLLMNLGGTTGKFLLS